MKETINLEDAVLENLRILPPDQQQTVLDFVQFLVQKAEQQQQLSTDQSITRSHDAFLNSYAPEDEGLYDD
jgi:hypothetical protein